MATGCARVGLEALHRCRDYAAVDAGVVCLDDPATKHLDAVMQKMWGTTLAELFGSDFPLLVDASSSPSPSSLSLSLSLSLFVCLFVCLFVHLFICARLGQ